MKRTHFAMIVVGLAIAALVMGGSRLRAQVGSNGSSGIPLSSLAGSFAGEGSSNFGLCFNKDFTAVQSCSTTPLAQIVSFVENSTNQGTINTKGNSCFEAVNTNAPLFPGPQPADINNYIAVGVITSYNPATGSGNMSSKFYIAGPGVTCKGATFINTANALVSFTVTHHFVVSKNGNRMDGVVRTLHTISPADFIAGYVGHLFMLRQ